MIFLCLLFSLWYKNEIKFIVTFFFFTFYQLGWWEKYWIFFFKIQIENIYFLYRTWRFSQLLDLLSLAQTLPSKLRTLRLALVRLPRYFLGELFSEQEPKGDLLRFFLDLLRNRSRVLSGFSNFKRICVSKPTSSSSTLWLKPTEVSMNLQS